MGAGRKPLETLDEVVEEAYRVFDFPVPDSHGVCVNCCMDPKTEKNFLNVPIREMPSDYLNDWFHGAVGPGEFVEKGLWGYLLPRILQMLVNGEDPATIGIQLSLNRFPTGSRDEWTDQQWAVLKRFHKLFLDRQKTVPTPDPLDDIICMFDDANFQGQASIAVLEAWETEELTLKLWHEWCQNNGYEVFFSSSWRNNSRQEIKNWYHSKKLFNRIFAFGSDTITPKELQQKAREVAGVIQGSRDWT